MKIPHPVKIETYTKQETKRKTKRMRILIESSRSYSRFRFQKFELLHTLIDYYDFVFAKVVKRYGAFAAVQL